jgi:hypothetical protein
MAATIALLEDFDGSALRVGKEDVECESKPAWGHSEWAGT